MRKTLAIPDGGALKVNCRPSYVKEVTSLKWFSFQDVYYLLQRFFELIVVRIARINIYSDAFISFKDRLNNVIKSDNDTTHSVKTEVPSSPSWSLAAYLSNQEYLDEVSLKRCVNFEFLTCRLGGIPTNIVFKSLPIGCVPQFFVLKDDRGILVNSFTKKVVAMNNWPGNELPSVVKDSPERFPVANKLNRTLLLLPLHQSTSQDQLDHIADILQN